MDSLSFLAPVVAAIVAMSAVLGVLGYVAKGWRRFRVGRERAEAREFVKAREHLKAQRRLLADSALAAVDSHGGPGIPLLVAPGWLPDKPVALDYVRLSAVRPTPPVPAPVKALAGYWPHRSNGKRYAAYSEAVGVLDRPRLFENRVSYRLMSIGASEDPHLDLGMSTCRYFDCLDTGESLAYEFARESSRRGSEATLVTLPKARLALADVFDFSNRAATPGINTLTVVVEGSDSATAWVHVRESKVVAAAMGVYHVVPAGEFQPSGHGSRARMEDLNLWRNIMREYNEELLGNPEAAQQEEPINYARSPYRDLDTGVARGTIRPFFLGMGLDPLTLKPEILTVCLFAANEFASIFPDFPPRSTSTSEGTFMPVPFTEAGVRTMVFEDEETGTLPAGAACLTLALRFRADLLSSVKITSGRKARSGSRGRAPST